MAPLQRLDLLAPEIWAREGGIQIYSRNLLRALRLVRPDLHLRVFICNDRSIPVDLDPLLAAVEWHPCSGSNRRLICSLLAANGRSRSQLLLSTHPNVAPLLLLQRLLSGAPAWAVAHGIDVWQLGFGLRRWSIQHLQQLLPVSRFTARSLELQLGKRCPPLRVLPNSVDPQRFCPGPRPPELLLRYGLQADQPVIFCLSRLSRFDQYKNIHALLEAMPHLLRQFPTLQLIIGGSGDDLPRLQALSNQLQLQGAVRFVGAIADAELVGHYRLATVFALPSEKEGFGIVFLEALACGTPVLAGNRDGSVDPLEDGRLGLLIDPHQPLAPGLQSLLERRGPALWFDPPRLAAATAESFGFAALCHQLDGLLREHERGDYAQTA